MNTRKLIKWVELVIFSILLAFFIPVIFEWIKTGSLEITSDDIGRALFFGILIPVIILLSKNIKSDYLIALIALILIFAFLMFSGVAVHF